MKAIATLLIGMVIGFVLAQKPRQPDVATVTYKKAGIVYSPWSTS